MAEAEVLHRDISRGNILCKPKHYCRDEEESMKLRPYTKAMLCVFMDDSWSLTIPSRDDDLPVEGRLTCLVTGH